MKIQVLRPATYRVSSGISLAYAPGCHTVPRRIGQSLVAAGQAEAIPANSNANSEE